MSISLPDPEFRADVRWRRARLDAELVGAIVMLNTAVKVWDERDEGTVGDIAGVYIAAEVLRDAAKRWSNMTGNSDTTTETDTR